MTHISTQIWLLAVLALMTIGAPAQASAKEFHYWARIPQSQLTCQQEAQALATRFTEATSYKVTEIKCLGMAQLPAEGKTYGLYSIDLTYQAEKAAEPYSAIYGSGDHSPAPRDSTGGYATFADCLDDLQSQTRLFQERTRLTAVSAGCEPGRFQFQVNYVLKVQSFGRPYESLYSVQFDFYGTPDTGYLNQVHDLVQQSGGTIARIWGNEYLYYAQHPVAVQYKRIANFDQAQQCEVQLDAVRSILSGAGAHTSIAGCLPLADPLMKGWVSLEVVDDSGSMLSSDFGGTAPKYFSFEECLGDRVRVIREAKSHGRTQTLGAVCHRDEMNSKQFVAELFEQL